jgi:hypothetical protein
MFKRLPTEALCVHSEVKHKHGEMTYKVRSLASHVAHSKPTRSFHSSGPKSSLLVCSPLISLSRLLILHPVPLATLVCPTLSPVSTSQATAILSPEGRKRFFVVHGGLFSRDGVTLDEIRKIQRIGRQPGNEGLMCEVRLLDE